MLNFHSNKQLSNTNKRLQAQMEVPNIRIIFAIFLVIFSCSWFWNNKDHPTGHDDFLQCLDGHSQNNYPISDVIYTPTNSSYLSVLHFPTKNLRFTTSSTRRPLVIVTPRYESQIQAVVHCAKDNGIQIRIRSGGHDYEGVSTTSPVPFVIIDLINYREITIDTKEETAWVQTGAQLGEVYYKISQASNTLAFPAGVCPTVGVGGHISGGGYGTLLRKYGLAADNVIDARMVDANGRILDREAMGEEVFWAIRGGGGGNFGIVIGWKLQLVHVPETVTIFSINRTLEQNMTKILHRWQYVAPHFPREMFIASLITKVNTSDTGDKQTIQSNFVSLFLGGADELLALMQERFPELGLKREDCNEVRWIQSALLFGNYPIGESPQVLTGRVPLVQMYFKSKSDYAQEPLPEHAFEGLWKLFDAEEANFGSIDISAYGGRNDEISDSALPFPHRAGNLFIFLNQVFWNEAGEEASERHINWLRKVYEYLTPYVSKSPRAAYVNYRDFDLGVNRVEGNTSYEDAQVWGSHYYKNNFNRLVKAKTIIDPTNFFRHEQSIPPTYSWSM